MIRKSVRQLKGYHFSSRAINTSRFLSSVNCMQILIVAINDSNNFSTLFTHRKPISLRFTRKEDEYVWNSRARLLVTNHYYRPLRLLTDVTTTVLIEVKRFSFLMFGTRTNRPTYHPPTHLRALVTGDFASALGAIFSNIMSRLSIRAPRAPPQR